MAEPGKFRVTLDVAHAKPNGEFADAREARPQAEVSSSTLPIAGLDAHAAMASHAEAKDVTSWMIGEARGFLCKFNLEEVQLSDDSEPTIHGLLRTEKTPSVRKTDAPAHIAEANL